MALLSVHDKTDLFQIARGLIAAGLEVVASGSTANALRSEEVSVTNISDLTAGHVTEVLDGEIEALHPLVSLLS